MMGTTAARVCSDGDCGGVGSEVIQALGISSGGGMVAKPRSLGASVDVCGDVGSADAEIGVMACSPERAGFRAVFEDLVVGAPIARNLHAEIRVDDGLTARTDD